MTVREKGQESNIEHLDTGYAGRVLEFALQEKQDPIWKETETLLSHRQVALNQYRYLWRHSNIVNDIVKNMDQKYSVHSDMDGNTTPNGGTFLAALAVTGLQLNLSHKRVTKTMNK